MQAVIIGFNQFTYIKNMASQLEKYPVEIIIIDNNSTFQPLLDWYDTCPHKVLRMKENQGNSIYQRPDIAATLGDMFLVTDPDIQLNPNLPLTFVDDLVDIARNFKVERVGFALDIQSSDIRSDCLFWGKTIREFESRYWKKRLNYKSYELYTAALDTTFCLVNKKCWRTPGKCIRVAGNFTAKHLPWHIGFADGFDKDELACYVTNQINTTNWFVPEKES